MNKPRILVVDDDQEIRSLLARYLVTQEFQVALASDKKSFAKAMQGGQFDLIVLDVMLPDGSGLDICRELRLQNSIIPIILLTALKEEVDRIIGLEFGADDYLGKPFNPRELVARIRAILRRHQLTSIGPKENQVFKFSGFEVQSTLRRVVAGNGEEVDLTAAEFDLLHSLLLRPGRVLSRDQLLNLTSSKTKDAFDRSIDVLMSRLRRKLKEAGGVDLIKTVRNGGYQFSANVDSGGPSV